MCDVNVIFTFSKSDIRSGETFTRPKFKTLIKNITLLNCIVIVLVLTYLLFNIFLLENVISHNMIQNTSMLKFFFFLNPYFSKKRSKANSFLC